MKKTVFLIGAKAFGNYGGYETFMDKLTEYSVKMGKTEHLQFYASVKANGEGHMVPEKTPGCVIKDESNFVYHECNSFRINIPEKLGPAQAIYYDYMSFKKCLEIIEKEKIQEPIIYIMTCRIGPFIAGLYKKLKKYNGKVYLNPDGHEWKRAKWPLPVRKYWKYSEKEMVKYSDLVVCDSVNIEKYIHDEYDGCGINGSDPKTVFIAYGSEMRKSTLADDDPAFLQWLKDKELKPDDYYLTVGRFVPENNFETMIREFMASDSKRKLAIITGMNQKFYDSLDETLHFTNDDRIRFVGTVYDQELLMKIRENAHAYIHGHSVGGTNPSLLEALSRTKLNLVFDVCFNKEVADDGALYWNHDAGNLKSVIEKADSLTEEEIAVYEANAKKRIADVYNWENITNLYDAIFRRNE